MSFYILNNNSICSEQQRQTSYKCNTTETTYYKAIQTSTCTNIALHYPIIAINYLLLYPILPNTIWIIIMLLNHKPSHLSIYCDNLNLRMLFLHLGIINFKFELTNEQRIS